MKRANNDKVNLKDKLLDIVPILAILIIVLLVAAMVSNEKNITKNLRINEISFKEYRDKITDDEFSIILIGRTNCSHCIEYKPLVNQVANDYGLDIWYVNVDNLEYDEYMYLHDNISALKDQYSDGEAIIPTPSTVIYKSGTEVNSILGNIGQQGFEKFIVENGVVK